MLDASHRPKTVKGISITREVVVAVDPKAAFDFVSAEDVLPKVLTGYGLIPAVLKTSGNTGPWEKPGSVRTVHLADGNTAREEVTDYDNPAYFAYRVSDFTFAVRHLANEARGQWWFTPVKGGTNVLWTYTFQPHNGLTGLPLSLFVHTQWAGYMNICMSNVKRHLNTRAGEVR
ncbi:MAG: SRPBCC family protein [Hyphomicrobiales bacterium]|nr:SRPBCC family protein [Hyphomicrobiales bacterium]